MAQQFRIKPTIFQMNSCKEFVEEFQIGPGDVVLTNKSYYIGFFDHLIKDATILFLQNYGKGEPTDLMVEKIYQDIKEIPFKRMFAIGGGTIIDISKLLVQETVSPILDLYDKKIPVKKVKELILVPTTCGTGSEVTSVAVIELPQEKQKWGCRRRKNLQMRQC